MSKSDKYDVVVIGGGPAGMMAAGTAADLGKKVLLLEKNNQLGQKLSITGGGRCNILNAEFDTRQLLQHYGQAEKFLYSTFSKFGVEDTWNFFENRHLPLKIEAKKRAFPKSGKAADVLSFFVEWLNELKVEIKTGVTVLSLEAKANEITGVETSHGNFAARTFILATGGVSHPETGSTGDGWQWLLKLGYKIHKANPDIVPLLVEEAWLKNLSGKTLTDVKVIFNIDKSSKNIQVAKPVIKRGNILCTHFGISGPTILNAAREVKELLKYGPVKSAVDLFPDKDEGSLRKLLVDLFEATPNKTLLNTIKSILPAGCTSEILLQFNDEIKNKKVNSVTKEERNSLVAFLKTVPLTVSGSKGMDWAVISDGGLSLSDVDTKTMRTKKHKNLLVTGDLLHINRPTGGYSLQICWTTGFVAGNNT